MNAQSLSGRRQWAAKVIQDCFPTTITIGETNYAASAGALRNEMLDDGHGSLMEGKTKSFRVMKCLLVGVTLKNQSTLIIENGITYRLERQSVTINSDPATYLTCVQL